MRFLYGYAPSRHLSERMSSGWPWFFKSSFFCMRTWSRKILYITSRSSGDQLSTMVFAALAATAGLFASLVCAEAFFIISVTPCIWLCARLSFFSSISALTTAGKVGFLPVLAAVGLRALVLTRVDGWAVVLAVLVAALVTRRTGFGKTAFGCCVG